ncbi:MAG: hypothetical protein P0111_01540 [Nitrospira sp.]|nr:hypothetical protein [Nitrospira sp.]
MFGSMALELAISMVFVYLLLSLLCTAINEWIAGLMALRPKTLEQGIRNLLNDRTGTGFAKRLYDHPLIRGLSEQGHKPSYIPSRVFALAFLDMIAPVDAAGSSRSLADVRTLVGKIADTELQRILLILIDQSGAELNRLRLSLENWYDESMNRVSGWYKKKTHKIIFVLAFLLTVLVNADTIMIVNALSRDATLRASIVAAAQQAAAQPLPQGGGQASETVTTLRSQINALQLPIGWSADARDSRAVPTSWGDALMKLVGLSLTVFAVSLGAPFWFDLLNKLVNIRSAGKPPETVIEREERVSRVQQANP